MFAIAVVLLNALSFALLPISLIARDTMLWLLWERRERSACVTGVLIWDGRRPIAISCECTTLL
jgi:hypothetical protein